MAVNVRGSFLVSKYALPLLKVRGGSILNLSSGVATTGLRNRAAYTASKGAILSLTRNMALDYAADGVRVNCLCPGFVDTPMSASLPFQPPFLWTADRAARHVVRALARVRRESYSRGRSRSRCDCSPFCRTFWLIDS